MGLAASAERPPSTVDETIRERDAELAYLGRCEAQLRLRIAELLDALFVIRGHHELGFSSIGAYVVERCQRSQRWGQETRALARRLRVRKLEGIRRSIREGRLGWSMAELLVRHARPENEEALIAEAAGSTIRAMQAKLTGPRTAEAEEPIEAQLVRAVKPEEVLMMHASRMLVGFLCNRRASDELLATALLGEAQTSLQLLEGARIENIVLPQLDPDSIEAGLRALREARAKRRLRTSSEGTVEAPPVRVEVVDYGPLPKTAAALDAELVRRCRDLAERNLRIGRLARYLFCCKRWRSLGYESAEQYAQDRVGLSLSSLEHRVTLVRRVESCPVLGEALERGEIGYESALLISRVLGRWRKPALVEAWIERAGVRTYKHLREEVDAVLLGTSLDATLCPEPPTAEDLEAVAELERSVQSGELFQPLRDPQTPSPQTSVTLVPDSEPTGSAGPAQPLRLTLPVELHLHWQEVEAQFRAVSDGSVSFIAFLCFNLWSTWLPFLEAWDDKWIDVYRRDRHRCSSPVCERRDVTPHHIIFKAHGGTDEAHNMLTACAWCHLHGIHRGRLSACGHASRVRWTVGRKPVMVVEGRERRVGAA